MIKNLRRLLDLATLLIRVFVCLPAVMSYGSTDGRPIIQFSTPYSNAVLSAGHSFNIVAFQSDSSTELRFISVYADSLLLGSTDGDTAAFTWSNAPVGLHVLTAIALDINGRFGTSPPVPLQVVAPPANDDWQNATVIDGTNISFSGTLFGATAQEGETLFGFFTKSIWWRWTAPVSAAFTIFSESDYPEFELAVVARFDQWASRREIFGVFATNNFQAMLTFPAEQGQTYWISAFPLPWNDTEVPIVSSTVTL